MNKEEKEVVNMIKTGLEVSVEGQIIEQIHISRKEAKALLNLIQKQDKIIDELKNHIYYKNCIACGKEFKAKRKDAKYCAYCSRSISNRAYYLSLTEEQKQKRREQAKLCMRRIRAERKEVEKDVKD